MNNKNLRKAFYEAAKAELEHLPKEEDVFRIYSVDFENIELYENDINYNKVLE